MCEIPHIIQYQHWIRCELPKADIAAWYVLSWYGFEKDTEDTLNAFTLPFSALTSSVSVRPPFFSLLFSFFFFWKTIESSCEVVKTLWNVTKEAAQPANGFN